MHTGGSLFSKRTLLRDVPDEGKEKGRDILACSCAKGKKLRPGTKKRKGFAVRFLAH